MDLQDLRLAYEEATNKVTYGTDFDACFMSSGKNSKNSIINQLDVFHLVYNGLALPIRLTHLK